MEVLKMQQMEDYKKELLSIFFAQRWIIFWITVIIFGCAILIAFLWPPTYSAGGSILVKGKKAEKSLGAIEKEEIRPFRLTKEDLASEIEIITSPDVIGRTIKYIKQSNLHLKSQKSGSEIHKIKNNLKTELVPASNVIKITLYSKNPQDAKTILEVLMEQYILYRMEIYNPVQTEVFLSNQVDNFKDSLKEKSDELVALSEKTKLSDPQKEMENNLNVKMDLEQQLNVLRNDAIEKRLYIEHLEKVLSDEKIHFFSSVENPAINGTAGLGPKLQELVAERRNVLRVYHPSSEKIQALVKQISYTYSALKNEVIVYKDNLSNQLRIINEKIINFEDSINNISKRNVEIRRQQININRIEKEVQMLLSSFETFSMRREEAKINSSRDTVNLSRISILSKAFSSGEPDFPKKKIVIPLGLIVGFIVGCSLGFFREYFDHTFKKPSDVETYTGLPVIFSIPK